MMIEVIDLDWIELYVRGTVSYWQKFCIPLTKKFKKFKLPPFKYAKNLRVECASYRTISEYQANRSHMEYWYQLSITL